MTHIDIVFDGPPRAVAGRFVEVEDSAGNGVKFGEWVERLDGYWALRIPAPQAPTNEEREDMIAWLMRDHGDELSPLGRDYTDAEIADMLRRPAQAEPTDAQVQAAIQGRYAAFRQNVHATETNLMRAALRAAFTAGQEEQA